jgi:putative spermidine/putrescine transport system substrate-binding protein
LIASALTAAVAGCGSSAGGNVKPSGNAKIGGTIVFGSPPALIQTGLESCAIPGFEKKYGVTVKYAPGAGAQLLASVLAARNSPPYDVIWASGSQQASGDAAGVFAKLAPSALPNLSRIPAKSRVGAGNGVPFVTSSVGILYNTQIFKQKGWAPPTSWNDLYDPRFKNREVIPDISSVATQLLIAWTAQTSGGSVDNTTAAFTRLAQLRPNIYETAVEQATMTTDMQQGTTWINVNSGAEAHDLSSSGIPIGFAVPKTGALELPVYLDVTKGSTHKAAATAFVNYMISPSVQNCLAAAIGYGPVAGKIPANLSQYFPSKVQTFDWTKIVSNLSAWTQKWDSLVAK